MNGINLSMNSNTPIYQQLSDQITSLILKSILESGYTLPTIRTAAKDLRISIITVKKAWEQLEREGLIYSVVGKGCFVSELTADELQLKRRDLIIRQLKKDLIFYKNLSASKVEILEIISNLY